MNYPKRYLVTSALPYANGPLHIGHLAGAYISADIFVRFLRLMDKDVLFICGSDENGAAITMRSKKEGIPPQEIVDKYHAIFKTAFDGVGLSFDFYHRTSAPLHHETSQEFFRHLNDKDFFNLRESEQYFDETAQQFLADRYIKGTCPKCGHEEAYGDQCENCGSTLSPTELINPSSTLSGAKPILKKTKHWYLPLDKEEAWLKEWINEGTLDGESLHDPKDWKNHVLGQCRSWLDGGLQERSMTRDLDWGIDVPQELEGADGKKIYVWMDAPIGYISSTKEWAKQNNADWEIYWKDKETALIHFIGKDNIVFHCLIFPAILKAHGDYVLPVNVPANQFMNLEGRKISTSKNWAVWVHEYLEDLPGREDELRYYMIKNMPETKDSEFTWKGFQEAIDGELVNNLANFVNRVIVLSNKYYEGVVPEFDESLEIQGAKGSDFGSSHEIEMLDLFDLLHEMCDSIRGYDFRGALKTLLEISSFGNQILQANEPWKLVKEDPETVKVVMNLSLQIVATLSVACRPFLPFTSDRLQEMLNLEAIQEKGELVEMLNQLAEGELIIPTGHKIKEGSHLFSRIPDEVIEKQIEKLNASSTADESSNGHFEALKGEISFDDFSKMDIRTGTILTAEKVKKADKLLQFTIDLGFETRTVVSGIAEHYKPEETIGKQVLVLANLAPRKIRGVESKGMILLAEDGDGSLTFVNPAEKAGNGLTVK